LRNNSQKILFEEIDKDADEEEYSAEMQLSYLIKTLGAENFTLIPVAYFFK
jgi:predicted class III extradiol MEMO1 family dioxygenase